MHTAADLAGIIYGNVRFQPCIIILNTSICTLVISETITSHEVITPIFEINDDTGGPVTFADYVRV